MIEYTHTNGIVFAVGQVWLTANNDIVKILQITDIVHCYDYPINTTAGRYTKDGHRHDKGKTYSDLKILVQEPETTKEDKTTEYKHPDSGIVFQVGQDWICMDGSIVRIIRFAPEAVHPIITTGEIYTKNGRFLFFDESDCDLKELVRKPEPTKETPEYKHPDNDIVFAVGQVWEDGDNEKMKITKICEKGDYPIKTAYDVFTKEGRLEEKETGIYDLKTLKLEPKDTPIITHPNGTVFEVWQLWKDSYGNKIRITAIKDEGKYPIETYEGGYTKEGKWSKPNHKCWLVELTPDTENNEPETTKETK